MSKKQSCTERWNAFWWEEIHPHPLALLRIMLGLFLFLYWCIYLPRVIALFSSEGIIIPFTDQLTAPSPIIALVLYTFLLYCICMFTLGWHMRIHGFCCIAFGIYYYLLSFHNFPSSATRIIVFVTFMVSISGADQVYSIKAKKLHGNWHDWNKVPAWPQRLLAVQLSATYIAVGLQKLILPDWQGGEILYYSFISRWATPFSYWFMQLGLPILFFDFMTKLVKMAHIGIGIFLWTRWRMYCVVVGLLFHTGVTLLMGMWWFMVLVPSYIVFFPPQQIYELAQRIKSSAARS